MRAPTSSTSSEQVEGQSCGQAEWPIFDGACVFMAAKLAAKSCREQGRQRRDHLARSAWLRRPRGRGLLQASAGTAAQDVSESLQRQIMREDQDVVNLVHWPARRAGRPAKAQRAPQRGTAAIARRARHLPPRPRRQSAAPVWAGRPAFGQCLEPERQARRVEPVARRRRRRDLYALAAEGDAGDAASARRAPAIEPPAGSSSGSTAPTGLFSSADGSRGVRAETAAFCAGALAWRHAARQRDGKTPSESDDETPRRGLGGAQEPQHGIAQRALDRCAAARHGDQRRQDAHQRLSPVLDVAVFVQVPRLLLGEECTGGRQEGGWIRAGFWGGWRVRG